MSQPPQDLPDPPDSESTIMIPRPGGRRAAPAPAPASAGDSLLGDLGGGLGAFAAEPSSGAAVDAPPLVGVNPLLAHASPLLNAVSTIRKTLSHRNPAGLREDLLRAITEFENGARRANASPEHVLISRYALCTMLDEAVGAMPWGESSGWSQRSLLVSMHKETFGGEKFFQLLEKALEDPRRNLDLLELMYVCIALGFEGRYRVLDNGRAQLDALRDRLLGVIKRERGEGERDLSVRWRGVERAPKPLVRRIPAWGVLGGVGLLLFAVYLGLVTLLHGKSDPVFGAIAAVRADPGKLKREAQPPAPPPAVVPRLKPLLADEISAGRLNVVEDEQASYVVIHGDSFFEPGKAEIKPALVPVIERIAQEMNKVPGSINIVGHTDNIPIRSLRFPSNFELSQERARGVAAIVLTRVKDAARVRTEGAAESRPLGPNDTPEGRAKNRRVEITLRYAG